MDLWDLSKLVFRRWYWTLPGLLLTAVAVTATLVGLPPSYVTTSNLQLVPPASRPAEPGEPTIDQRNPWLSLGLYGLANAAVTTLEQPSVVESIKAAGLSEAYTLTIGQYSPLVTFEVTGDTKQESEATSAELIRRFTSTVRDLQIATKPVADEDLVTVQRIDTGPNVVEETGKIKRAAVAVGGLGVLLTAASVIWLDSLLRRRARRRTGLLAEIDVARVVMPISPLTSSPLVPISPLPPPPAVIPMPPPYSSDEPPTAPIALRTSPAPVAPPPDQTVVLPRANGQRRGANVEGESRTQ